VNQLKWNATALDDLQRIAEFIREHAFAKEQATISALVERTNQLRSQPRSGQKRETLSNGTEIRSLLIGKHYRLLYAVALSGDVTITQVLDLRSDQDFYR